MLPATRQSAFHDLRSFDADGSLVERGHLSDADIDECLMVMAAISQWRDADRALSEASRRYMKLNETDMRAIRFLIDAAARSSVVTPKVLSAHLNISSASTTKMLDRLERGGHLRRSAHPTDRRTLSITVTAETRRAARESVGRQHARRFAAAAALSSDERSVVVKFLLALADADTPIGILAEDAHGQTD